MSAGVGETTIPLLSRRGLTMPVVAAATVLVAVTVGAAVFATAACLPRPDPRAACLARGVLGTPRAVMGEELAVRSQGRVPEWPVGLCCSGLFLLIAAAFVALALR